MAGWIEVSVVAYATGEAFGGLGKGGLVTIIVVSVIAVAAFVWLLRESGRGD